MTAKGTFFPKRTNDHVPNMQYAADVHLGKGGIVIPAMPAASADGILAAHDIATAGATDVLADTYSDASMGKFGRNVKVVASGAATSKVTVHGRDYLGQLMSEELTLNGTTAVLGKKAFASVHAVEYGATAATTIDLGWGDVLGLPYKVIEVDHELVNGAVPSNAGTVIAGLANDTDATATNADTRGTYKPHSSVVPNGSREYKLTALWDDSNLHGNVQFAV